MLRPIVEEAGEAALAGAQDRGVRVIDTVDDALEIDADPEQLYRILLNLLRNAAQAVGPGRQPVVCRAARRAGHVTIDIADDGPGHSRARSLRACSSLLPARRAPAAPGLGWRSAAISHAPMAATSRWIETGPDGTRFRIDIPDRQEH